MSKNLKPANRKRLASLTALGAGALGVAAGPAQANDIKFSGILNINPWGYTIPGPNGAGGFIIGTPGCIVTCFSFWGALAIYSKQGKYGTQFRAWATEETHYIQGEPQAAVWGTVAGKSTKSAAIIATWDGNVNTTLDATDRYMLFRFEGGALKHAMYGWARLDRTGHAGITLVDWAYDPTGIHLPAGYHASGESDADVPARPEASQLDASGLPALQLGATGVRHWRAARIAEGARPVAVTPAP